MKQIIIIHGWGTFRTDEDFYEVLKDKEYNPFEEKKDRKDRLVVQLKETYQAIKPTMPNKNNARYQARKIRFEKIFPYLNDEEKVLVGHSRGGNFLLKYLIENWFPGKIKQLHLVAAVIDETNRATDQEYMWDFAFDLKKIPEIEKIAEEIFIYHSTDDPIVPYVQAEKIKSYLPKAKLVTFTDRGHINDPEFPELLKKILK